MWPSLVDMSKEDCRRALRSLELETYGNAVSVLRAQGSLGPEKRKLLQDLASALNIPIERHKAEVRKAVNDEKLNTIAEVLFGPNTATEWAIEGRRLIPLIPREPPRTAYSLIADQAASFAANENLRMGPPSESANRASESSVIAEPASPEPTKTQQRSQSPPGIVMLPSGTAIQIKRESEEDERATKRRRSGSQDLNISQSASPMSPPATVKHSVITSSQLPMTSRTLTFPTGSTPLKIALPTSASRNSSSSVTNINNPKVIIVSSATSPGTSSILQKTLSVPMKSVASNTAANSSKASVVYTQSVPQQIIATTLSGQNAESTLTPGFIVSTPKVRTKPITAGSIPKPRPSAIVVSSQGTQSPQSMQLKNPSKSSTPVYQSSSTASSVPHLKTALQTTKHTVPIQSLSGLQIKSQERTQPTKILVQQKALPRAMQKTISQKGTTVQHKSVHPGMIPKTNTHSVIVQQKAPQKQNVVTSVQVKTAQGYANVPIQLRTAKQPGVQLKQEQGGTMKMLAISAGAKILPKPSQPVYMMATSTSGLSVVTRTIPSSSSSRVMTISTPAGAQVRTSQSNIFTTTKSMQTVLMTQNTKRQNVVLLQKGMTPKCAPVSQGGKEILGKMLMSKSSQGGLATITVQKPPTTITSSSFAQSLQQLPVAQTQAGNVILLDLSNQESMSKNAAIAELLQASGILGETGLGEKSKVVTTDDNVKVLVQSEVGEMDEPTKVRERVPKSVTKVDHTIESGMKGDEVEGAGVPTLSIEEAVEMLNRSDTPETRALLSQAGIQISDEIGDSEEEEVLESQIIEVKGNEGKVTQEQIVIKKDDSPDLVGELDPSTGIYSQGTTLVSTPTVSIPMTTTPRTMDIFSTALASANINLDNFMEEEDEPEQMLVEVPSTSKGQEEESDVKTNVSETSQSQNDSTAKVDTNEVSESDMPSEPDPIELQLAKLTEDGEN